MDNLKPYHFAYPVLFGLVGYWITDRLDWVFAGGFCYAVAVICLFWMFYYLRLAWKIESRREVKEFIKNYMKLSDQEKTELGILVALERVKVETVRRDARGTWQGKSIEQLPQGVTPAKWFMFCNDIANMYLEGGQTDQGFSHDSGVHAVSFSYDLFGRPNKLFSQPVYKSLLEWLEGKEYIEKQSREFWITESGVDFFLGRAGKDRPQESRDLYHESQYMEPTQPEGVENV